MYCRQLTAAQVTMATLRLWFCLLPLLSCSALVEPAINFAPLAGKVSFQIFYLKVNLNEKKLYYTYQHFNMSLS
jgi:hypothetical protein